ncbi:phenylacetate-CoA oxygenase subunit PaaC [Nemorincola caseinilytica]|uniref:Phenylacetate-CoA oxygenase subunit PaaC n=1 Tax=Nemorincola caseinilytica TaxID=2054315 RepID=A0ABP8NIV2_9BACT
MNLIYTLRLADDALILGHRISEWCGHGPILEQDIALTNTSLDHIGRARSLYQYAAAQFNALPAEAKAGTFASVMLNDFVSKGAAIDEDDLAYLRDGNEFYNLLLLEQPNNDWAYTVARSFYYDAFNVLFWTELERSADTTLAAIAGKSLKEATYHLRWSSEWVIRLGDGTEESHSRMQQAVNDLWMYTGELFMPNDAEVAAANAGGVDITKLEAKWTEKVAEIFAEATLAMPAATWMQKGGKKGIHSEHLGYILAEMQYLQRAYPGMEW